MNAEKSVEATPRCQEWHSINWKNLNETVRRLQNRIAKATREGDNRRVRKLQILLTRSFAAKAIAVKRVTENTGKRTPGIDGKTWSTPAEKWHAIFQMEKKGYKPAALKRVYIPKSSGKLRPLGIPTMKDRAMQALHKLALEPIAETTADINSYGFRPVRSCADAIGQVFINLAKDKSAQWILEGDIKGCFDNISHQWLPDNIPMDKQILRKWLKAGFMDKNSFHKTDAGTPQGGIISPLLANMCLDGLEEEIRRKFGKTKAQRNRTKINYVRYADDFIITGISKEILEKEVKPLVEEFMATRGLRLSDEKTIITHIDDGFDFLGQNARKYDGKMLIKPSKKNMQTFLRNIKATIDDNKTATAFGLIKMLNPKIRGWANYHRHIVAKESFSKTDHQIWAWLWKWCKRRHPNKGTRWIKSKYFHAIGNRSWVFTGTGKRGETARLFSAASVKIERHVKVRAEAKLFDPKDANYFEQRSRKLWRKANEANRKATIIWKRQDGKCPICGEMFEPQQGTKHIHHIKPKQFGDTDELDNLVMLHPNCHRQLHNGDVTGFAWANLLEA